MTEQERFEEIYRQRQPVVVIQRPTPPLEPAKEHPPVPAPKPSPLPRSCQPLEHVIIVDIHLSWNCVARLSLQFVLMSSLVAAFIAGAIWILAGIAHGLAASLQTLPPPPLR
jgi:hypothetical protein